MTTISEVPGPATHVLVVCTGNICRSPAAELLLRTGMGGHAGIRVTSAGLEALVGEPMAEPMARLVRARGIDPGGSTARQLHPPAVRDAALVLTMTVAQRRAVVTSAPSAVRRTFTLREFASIAGLAGIDGMPGGPAERIAAVLQAAPCARSSRVMSDRDDDIEDPYGRSAEVFARVFAAIEADVDRLLGVLAPPAPAPVPSVR